MSGATARFRAGRADELAQVRARNPEGFIKRPNDGINFAVFRFAYHN